MDLVILYGPPAVGKLTIAKGLAMKTGFKLFHNHLSLDLVTSIFERGSEAYYAMVRKIRMLLIQRAIEENIHGIILTYVYTSSRHNTMKKYTTLVEERDGNSHLIHLTCSRETLLERVSNSDRVESGKISDPQLLETTLEQLGDPFSKIKGKPSITIDTGKFTVEESVNQIVAYIQEN